MWCYIKSMKDANNTFKKTKLEAGCYMFQKGNLTIRADRSKGKWIVSALSFDGKTWNTMATVSSLSLVEKVLGE